MRRDTKVRNIKKSFRRKPLNCLYDSLPLKRARGNDPRLRNPLFIMGSERSGTTILGDLLKCHRHIHCTVERDPVFSYNYTVAMQVARMLRDKAGVSARLKRYYVQNWLPLVEDCDSWRCKCQENFFPSGAGRPRCCWRGKDIRLFADKSHHTILFPELLSEVFPEARFVWIYRDARDVVTSMLRHHGVRTSIDFGPKVLVPDNLPNVWAGIEKEDEIAPWFELPLAAKCAKRWASWTREGHRWAGEMPERVYTIKYEDMVEDPEKILGKFVSFLGLSPCDNFNSALNNVFGSSVGAWRENLSSDEVACVLDHAGEVMDLLGYSTD